MEPRTSTGLGWLLPSASPPCETLRPLAKIRPESPKLAPVGLQPQEGHGNPESGRDAAPHIPHVPTSTPARCAPGKAPWFRPKGRMPSRIPSSSLEISSGRAGQSSQCCGVSSEPGVGGAAKPRPARTWPRRARARGADGRAPGLWGWCGGNIGARLGVCSPCGLRGPPRWLSMRLSALWSHSSSVGTSVAVTSHRWPSLAITSSGNSPSQKDAQCPNQQD